MGEDQVRPLQGLVEVHGLRVSEPDVKAPTITEVRKAHGQYGDALVRWGENNMETSRAMIRYWDLRTAFEATGKTYTTSAREARKLKELNK